MAANILKFLLLEIIFNEVIASYLPHQQKYYQVPSQQYYQLPGTGSTGTATSSYASPPSATYQSAVVPSFIEYSAYTPAKPYNPAAEKLPSYNTPPVASAQPSPLPINNTPNPKNVPSLTTPPFDSNVLNNLAIALQLLIVSNLLNMPVPERIEKSNTILPLRKTSANEYGPVQNINPISAYFASSNLDTYPSAGVPSNPEAQGYQAYFESNSNDPSANPQYVPNANYLGSSNNFGGLLGSLGVPPAKARPGLNLKSPYDAISSPPETPPHSPFEYRKADFQSPYAAILAADSYKDLFSMDF
ncbi:unnamed protein product, partial [Iphiclides podalirius]